MTQVISTKINSPSIRFQWKDSQGNLHYPEDMETRHLFFTFRMIWNHSMPEEYKLHPYRKHSFSGFYSYEYIKKSLYNISAELFMRKDIAPHWQSQLEYMRLVFRDGIHRLEAPIARISDA